MEVELHIRFKAVRLAGGSINHNWFIHTRSKIFEEIYPDQIGFDNDNKAIYDCAFSDGWFSNFKQWWSIS